MVTHSGIETPALRPATYPGTNRGAGKADSSSRGGMEVSCAEKCRARRRVCYGQRTQEARRGGVDEGEHGRGDRPEGGHAVANGGDANVDDVFVPTMR